MLCAIHYHLIPLQKSFDILRSIQMPALNQIGLTELFQGDWIVQPTLFKFSVAFMYFLQIACGIAL